MVISGILLGVVTLNSTVGEREWLRQEARRIALLLQMARDEAIVRDRSISLVLDEYRYRFLIRQNTQWELMADDPIWREREFTHAPVEITLTPSTNAQSPITIFFGREPVNSPFVLTLAQNGQSASVSADGLGNFQVK
jgi:general secretion pathway protein H